MGIKVLMLGPYPYLPGKLIGGVEAVVSSLADGLSRSEQIEKVVVYNFFRDSLPAKHTQISEKLAVFYEPAQTHYAQPTRGWLNYRKIRRFCQTFQPDIVHAQGIHLDADAAIRLGVPVVVSVHGMVHVEARMHFANTFANRWRLKMIDAMVRRILENANVVISTSSYDFNALKNQISGQHLLIANPVDLAFFETQENTPTTEPVILFAGVMRPRKNVTGLLRAFQQVRNEVPNARLVIVGPAPDANYAHEVHQLTAQLNLQTAVEFGGFVENDELICRIIESRVLVLFSNEETSPTIIAQAMAVGKPVIAARVGGVAELVAEGQGGFLVNAQDEQALAKRLTHILQTPQTAQAMGAYNRQVAAARSHPDKVAQNTIAAYQLAASQQV